MRRLLSFGTISLLAASLFIAPALAAPPTSPHELLTLLQGDTQPMDFSYEIHGRYLQHYFSLWVSGSTQGASDPLDRLSAMKATVDVVSGPVKARAKLQMRQTGRTLYVLLESIDGTADHELVKFVGKLTGKKWLAIPLDAGAFGFSADESSLQQQEMLRTMAGFFSFSSTTEKGTTTYSLTLTRDAAKSILLMLRGMVPEADAELPSPALPPRLSAIVTVKTNAQDLPRSSLLTFSLQSSALSLTAKGKTTVRGTAVQAAVPANALGIQHVLDSLDVSSLPSWEAEQEMSVDLPPAEPEEDLPADPCLTDPALLRTPLCPLAKPPRKGAPEGRPSIPTWMEQ